MSGHCPEAGSRPAVKTALTSARHLGLRPSALWMQTDALDHVMEARLIQLAYHHGVHAVTLDAEILDGPLRRCGASLDLLS